MQACVNRKNPFVIKEKTKYRELIQSKQISSMMVHSIKNRVRQKLWSLLVQSGAHIPKVTDSGE